MTVVTNPLKDEFRSVFTRVRLLQIFTALGRAGLVPISTTDVHSFAFFSNVMSPLWDLEPLDGAVLKQAEGPYYPSVQTEIDWLIGNGFLEVSTLAYRKMPDATTRLDATFTVAGENSDQVVQAADSLPDEENTLQFLTELAFSFGEIKASQRGAAAAHDATFSNLAIADDRVIDFAQYDASVSAANRLQKYAPPGVTLNRAEKLSMYMSLMARRANG